MNVLVACEESQEVCKAFRARGHNAFSCDIQRCSGGHPEWHFKINVLDLLWAGKGEMFITQSGELVTIDKWDLVIAHPPCTRLTNSGVRWLISKTPRPGYTYSYNAGVYVIKSHQMWQDLRQGIEFFKEFQTYGEYGNRIVIENPIPHKYAANDIWINEFNFQKHPERVFGIGSYTQIIEPYQHGHLEKKATCLWLYNLPEIIETNNVYQEMMLLPYKDRAKVHHAPPGPERTKLRSKTYPGIAQAMAEQWG